MAEPGGRRVHVSEELLRAVLAEFKYELAENLSRRFEATASKVALDSLEKAMKLAIAGHDTRLQSLENWRSGRRALGSWQRWFFGVVCVGLVAGIATTVYLIVT